MMVSAATEEDHTDGITVCFLEAHDFTPELRGSFNIGHFIDHMAELVHLDRGYAEIFCWMFFWGGLRNLFAKLLVY